VPDLSDEMRYRIAIAALIEMRQPYPISEIAALAGHCIKGLWNRGGLRRHPPQLVCSQLYDDAYRKVTGLGLKADNRRATTPADLSLTTELVDVPVYWRELEK
jgi:hypothetical protein